MQPATPLVLTDHKNNALMRPGLLADEALQKAQRQQAVRAAWLSPRGEAQQKHEERLAAELAQLSRALNRAEDVPKQYEAERSARKSAMTFACPAVLLPPPSPEEPTAAERFRMRAKSLKFAGVLAARSEEAARIEEAARREALKAEIRAEVIERRAGRVDRSAGTSARA